MTLKVPVLLGVKVHLHLVVRACRGGAEACHVPLLAVVPSVSINVRLVFDFPKIWEFEHLCFYNHLST